MNSQALLNLQFSCICVKLLKYFLTACPKSFCARLFFVFETLSGSPIPLSWRESPRLTQRNLIAKMLTLRWVLSLPHWESESLLCFVFQLKVLPDWKRNQSMDFVTRRYSALPLKHAISLRSRLFPLQCNFNRSISSGRVQVGRNSYLKHERKFASLLVFHLSSDLSLPLSLSLSPRGRRNGLG